MYNCINNLHNKCSTLFLFYYLIYRGDHFRFGSVFIKKNNQTEIFFLKKKPKPNRNRVKPTGFNLVSVRFGFFRQKTGLARFFSIFSVSVRFGFFSFLLIKPKPNQTGCFFQNFNRFFFGSVFSVIFFPV
jgi:hypothetical protein